MDITTFIVILRQGEQTQQLILSQNKAKELKLYRQGVNSVTLDVENIKLAIQAFFRLAGIYSPIDNSDWKTRLDLFIFQEKFFLSSEKELLDFQVPPEQFREFFVFCAKESDVLSGKISFTSHWKSFLEYKSRENSSPDIAKETPVEPVISTESPCAPVTPVILNLVDVPDLVDMSEPVIPKVVEPLVQDSSDCHSQNPVILNNRAPGCEQDNVREFPVQATWTQGLPSKHPDLAEEKKYRLKRKAQITGVLFSYGEDGGEIIVKTTKNKTLSHATKIDPVDIKVYKNFIIYLEEDGDVFVRKFEGETLGEPVLLTTGKDYVELEVSSDGKHLMFFDKKRVCRVAGVDLEKGEVLNSFSLSSNSGEYFLDPSGNCYTIDDDNLTRPDGTNILVKCLVVAGEKGEKRRIISPLSKYVVAALAHSKVVVSEADGSYAVYDKELNEVSRFRSPLGSDAYLWSGGLGEYCALLLRGNEVNQCQLVVYNSATNVWTSQVKNVNGELKLLKGEYRSDIILTRLANGTPVIVTCSQAKKLRLVIYSLPREDSPKVKVIFKQKMKKINGRNELPTDLSVF